VRHITSQKLTTKQICQSSRTAVYPHMPRASIVDRRQSPPLTVSAPSVEGTGIYRQYLPPIRPILGFWWIKVKQYRNLSAVITASGCGSDAAAMTGEVGLNVIKHLVHNMDPFAPDMDEHCVLESRPTLSAFDRFAFSCFSLVRLLRVHPSVYKNFLWHLVCR